jgi:hypothetical protein
MTDTEIIEQIIAFCSKLPQDEEMTTATMVLLAIPDEACHDQAFAAVKRATCTKLARYCNRGPERVGRWGVKQRPWLWHGEAEPHEEAKAPGSSRSDQLDRIEAKLDQVLALLAP